MANVMLQAGSPDVIYVCGYCLKAGALEEDIEHEFEECAAGDWVERKYIGS